MREKKHSFFLRQHIKIMPKPRPSDREDVIRLKFLEVPYRLYYKLPKGYRIALLSILWTCFITLVIYKGIMRALRFEYKAKLRASLGNDERKILELMEKVKLK